MSRLARDGTAEPNPSCETQFLGAYGDRGIFIFPCSADHEQDWQPCPVDPYSAKCDDHTYIHIYIGVSGRLKVEDNPFCSKRCLVLQRDPSHEKIFKRLRLLD